MLIGRVCLAELMALAAGSPGKEICGLLFGSDARIYGAMPALNISDRPGDEFEIDPAALIAAYKAERAGGPRVIGCYHSHPSGSAVPSERDAAAAEPGRLWLILGGGDARLWRARPGGFDEEAINTE